MRVSLTNQDALCRKNT